MTYLTSDWRSSLRTTTPIASRSKEYSGLTSESASWTATASPRSCTRLNSSPWIDSWLSATTSRCIVACRCSITPTTAATTTSTPARSEEHTSELQSLMRTSYAVFCLQKKNKIEHATNNTQATQA